MVRGNPVSTSSLGNTAFAINSGVQVITHLTIKNDGATKFYVKIYDKATAPTAADTPVWRMPFAAGEGLNGPVNIDCALGAWARATTELADVGTTSPTTDTAFFNATGRKIL